MAKSDTFQCSVVTPERAVLECEATFVAFPAHDGEIGVLTRRAPLVCKLGIGQLRVETPAQGSDHGGAAKAKPRVFFIDGGFAQVVENRLTILTEQAKEVDEIDAATAEQALVEARAMKVTDDNSLDARGKAIQRARVQLKLVRSS